MTWHRNLILWAGLIFLITFVTYSAALRGGFIWDDQHNVVQNQLLRTWAGLRKTWVDPKASIQYYPLTYTGFWLEYQCFGLRPFGYHVVNVTLHALNAFLIGVLLTRLSTPGAWLAAIIFAVHPVHVESVAWIAELKNTLSGLFFLGALLAYLRFALNSGHRKWFYGLAFLFFLCALLSKTATMALPGVILFVLWWKRGGIRWQDCLRLIPFVLAAVAMGRLTTAVEQHHVGAQGPEWHLSLAERCLLAGRAVWFYAGKLVWPHPLMFIYPHWQIDSSDWAQYLYPIAMVLVLLSFWLFRDRLGKAPFVAMALFVGMLVPVPAFFNLYFMRYSYVTDHFQYLPSVGIIALLCGSAVSVVHERQVFIAIAMLIVAGLATLSWQHGKAFRDEETIWRDTLAKNPTCWLAYDNLGHMYQEAGNLQEAISHYERELRIKPDDAEGHYNLANALSKSDRFKNAVEQYEEALRLDPNYPEAHNNLAFVLLRAGMTDDAIRHLEEATRMYPGSAEAQYNLGKVYLQLGRIQDATMHLGEAVRLKPDFAAAHHGLGVSLASQGRTKDAMSEYWQALRLRPDYAETRNDLGAALAAEGKLDEAVAHFKAALEVDSNYADAHYNLGMVLAREGKVEEAVSHLQSAVKLQPDSGRFHRALERLQQLRAQEPR